MTQKFAERHRFSYMMAVYNPPDGRQSSSPLSYSPSRKRSHSSMSATKIPSKWIDEEVYRTSILSLYPAQSESEADEKLQTLARDLGLSPVRSVNDSAVDIVTATISEVTIASETPQGSIVSQSTAPTSCDSSVRRPSTSLSNKSSILDSQQQPPTNMIDLQRKRHSGFKDGLRKMTGFRKKKSSASSTPSMTSLRSQTTETTTNGSILSPLKSTTSLATRNSYPSYNVPPPPKEVIFEPVPTINEEALQRSLICDELVQIRVTQLEEKMRFLDYQSRLIKDLRGERERIDIDMRTTYLKRVADQEDKNEKAFEALEAHQLEDELKQQKEHEAEKRTMLTRLKHMEAYCRTPSPPQSPFQTSFDLRASEDSLRSLPERHITPQHYENLAQTYHIRDNMDDLHESKINVLRGKQKRALQNFMLRKERELEQMEKEHEKELASLQTDYSKKEAEIRHEFAAKRTTLEARWKLQALVERTRMERSTGLKYEDLPEVLAVEA